MQTKKLITTIVLGTCGGLIFISFNSGSIIGAFIFGAILGLAFLGWLVYFLVSGVARAKKFAEQSIKDGEIKDFAKAKRVVAALNVLGDTDSKYLLIKLKELETASMKK